MPQLSDDEQMQLTRLIITLLDDWGLTAAQMVCLLSLPQDTRAGKIRQYRLETPLPRDKQVMERVEHLVGIADALRTTYPRNAQMGPIWLNQPNDRFDERAPLQVMLEDGLDGLISVRTHLDCAYDWDLSGSKASY